MEGVGREGVRWEGGTGIDRLIDRRKKRRGEEGGITGKLLSLAKPG